MYIFFSSLSLFDWWIDFTFYNMAYSALTIWNKLCCPHAFFHFTAPDISALKLSRHFQESVSHAKDALDNVYSLFNSNLSCLSQTPSESQLLLPPSILTYPPTHSNSALWLEAQPLELSILNQTPAQPLIHHINLSDFISVAQLT